MSLDHTAAGSGRAAAWEAECLERERREGTLATLCTALLIPAWAVFDLALEPALTPRFLAVRLAASAVSWLLLVPLRRASRIGQVRALIAANIALTGPSIAWMLPQVHEFPAYVFGYSLFFWASGALLTWPARYGAATFGWLLAVLAAATALTPGPRLAADHVLAGFYLASAAILGTLLTYAHRGALQRAFEASFELRATLARLRDAQARLVASEKLSALGRLLAGLSHEINNPVNVLHNNLEPVREHLTHLLELVRLAASPAQDDQAAFRARWGEVEAGWLVEDLPDALVAMRAAVDRIRQVHLDLRAFIRGDAPEPVAGDVNDGLRATVALLGRRLPAGVRLEASYAELPRATFQPGQLNQLWHNLIQNALDAVAAQGMVAVRSRALEGAIEVSVTDTGPGVPPAVRDRLFEPFFTTKGAGGGTGLGLATCYQIVERHRGSIELDPAHAPGARFVVRLPAS